MQAFKVFRENLYSFPILGNIEPKSCSSAVCHPHLPMLIFGYLELTTKNCHKWWHLLFLKVDQRHSSTHRFALFPLLSSTLPGTSLSEVMTLWCYTNLFINNYHHHYYYRSTFLCPVISEQCIISSITCGCVVRYGNDMYKCLYNDLKTSCNATASYIYTTYEVTKWNRLLDGYNCSISKYFSLSVSYNVYNCPSLVWCCWLGDWKGICPLKNSVVGCWHGCVWVTVQICIWPS